MSLNRFSLTDGTFLLGTVVTGDSEYRDQSLARADKGVRAVEAAMDTLHTALMALEIESGKDGLDEIEDAASEARTTLTEWYRRDYIAPIQAALMEAG